ncbi:hypothetical protein C5F48_18695 [Cereibacter changlensis JA139]|uniref:Uncharacterized protein n=1 Tax=Cereibacter changlensis JA139 TaxID=1188249 RepID=A0A2T4JQN3_9RHOB|nr:hypothetical protein C5F48_18695 [Cereibacter changlensis JA139]
MHWLRRISAFGRVIVLAVLQHRKTEHTKMLVCRNAQIVQERLDIIITTLPAHQTTKRSDCKPAPCTHAEQHFIVNPAAGFAFIPLENDLQCRHFAQQFQFPLKDSEHTVIFECSLT